MNAVETPESPEEELDSGFGSSALLQSPSSSPVLTASMLRQFNAAQEADGRLPPIALKNPRVNMLRTSVGAPSPFSVASCRAFRPTCTARHVFSQKLRSPRVALKLFCSVLFLWDVNGTVLPQAILPLTDYCGFHWHHRYLGWQFGYPQILGHCSRGSSTSTLCLYQYPWPLPVFFLCLVSCPSLTRKVKNLRSGISQCVLLFSHFHDNPRGWEERGDVRQKTIGPERGWRYP